MLIIYLRFNNIHTYLSEFLFSKVDSAANVCINQANN